VTATFSISQFERVKEGAPKVSLTTPSFFVGEEYLRWSAYSTSKIGSNYFHTTRIIKWYNSDWSRRTNEEANDEKRWAMCGFDDGSVDLFQYRLRVCREA